MKKKNMKSSYPAKSSVQQAILQPDHRTSDTHVAQPDDGHVEQAREWVIINKK